MDYLTVTGTLYLFLFGSAWQFTPLVHSSFLLNSGENGCISPSQFWNIYILYLVFKEKNICTTHITSVLVACCSVYSFIIYGYTSQSLTSVIFSPHSPPSLQPGIPRAALEEQGSFGRIQKQEIPSALSLMPVIKQPWACIQCSGDTLGSLSDTDTHF